MGGLFSKSTEININKFSPFLSKLSDTFIRDGKIPGEFTRNALKSYISNHVTNIITNKLTLEETFVLLAVQDEISKIEDTLLSKISDTLTQNEIDMIIKRPVLANMPDRPYAYLKAMDIYEDIKYYTDRVNNSGGFTSDINSSIPYTTKLAGLQAQIIPYLGPNYAVEAENYKIQFETQRKQQEPELAKMREKIVSTFKSALQSTYNDPAFKEVFDKYRKAVTKSGGADIDLANISPILLLALCVVLVLLMICQNFDMIHSVILGVVVYFVLYSYFKSS